MNNSQSSKDRDIHEKLQNSKIPKSYQMVPLYKNPGLDNLLNGNKQSGQFLIRRATFRCVANFLPFITKKNPDSFMKSKIDPENTNIEFESSKISSENGLTFEIIYDETAMVHPRSDLLSWEVSSSSSVDDVEEYSENDETTSYQCKISVFLITETKNYLPIFYLAVEKLADDGCSTIDSDFQIENLPGDGIQWSKMEFLQFVVYCIGAASVDKDYLKVDGWGDWFFQFVSSELLSHTEKKIKQNEKTKELDFNKEQYVPFYTGKSQRCLKEWESMVECEPYNK